MKTLSSDFAKYRSLWLKIKISIGCNHSTCDLLHSWDSRFSCYFLLKYANFCNAVPKLKSNLRILKHRLSASYSNSMKYVITSENLRSVFHNRNPRWYIVYFFAGGLQFTFQHKYRCYKTTTSHGRYFLRSCSFASGLQSLFNSL